MPGCRGRGHVRKRGMRRTTNNRASWRE
jgi:hypothetical protein